MPDEDRGRLRPNDAVGRLLARVVDLLATGWVPTITSSGSRWERHTAGQAETQDLTPADGVALDGLAIIRADEGHGWPHRHLHAGQPYHHRHRGGHRRHTHIQETPPA